jgi:hypothetical protein
MPTHQALAHRRDLWDDITLGRDEGAVTGYVESDFPISFQEAYEPPDEGLSYNLSEDLGQSARTVRAPHHGSYIGGGHHHTVKYSIRSGIGEQGGSIVTVVHTANTAQRTGINAVLTSTPAFGAGTTPRSYLDTKSQAIQSPFAQLSRILGIAPALSGDVAAKIKVFIERILANEGDLTEEGIVPNLSAFHGLIVFLVRHPLVRMPGLTITRDGAFAAIWDHGREARIRLDFIGTRRVRWVIVNTGPVAANGSGELDQKGLDAIMEAYGAQEWMTA